MGVTITKKINPIINGEINSPRIIPILNQSLFNGNKIFEFSKPRIKKNIDIIKVIILIFPSLIMGKQKQLKKIQKKQCQNFCCQKF